MRGSTEIIVSSEPRGVFKEGTISGTPKPGTCMEIVPGTVDSKGRFTWRASTKSTGAKQLVCVLLPDALQGQLPTAAYVSGVRCFMYVPAAGEELNMLVADVAGTADDITAGSSLFGIETVTGKLKLNSSYASPCFTALETVTDPVADTLLWCMFNGH